MQALFASSPEEKRRLINFVIAAWAPATLRV